MKKIVMFFMSILLLLILHTTVFADSHITGKITTEAVNFRSGMSVNDSIIEKLDKDTIVNIISYQSETGYFEVSYNNQIGYIYAMYIYIEDRPSGYGVISADGVNLRSNPSTNTDVITKLNKDTLLKIYGLSDEWYMVEYENQLGWIHSSLVLAFTEVLNPCIATTANVNIRTGPSTNYQILDTTYNDQPFYVLGRIDKWYCLIDSDGCAVWIYKDFLAAVKNTSSRGEEQTINNANIEKRNKVIEIAKSLSGTPYVWAGESTSGFDCSGFVQYVFKKIGVTLPHSSKIQSTYGRNVSVKDLNTGDLLFFDTNGGLNEVNHVGIYIGDGYFIHASSSNGKVVTTYLFGYYYKYLYCVRNVID